MLTRLHLKNFQCHKDLIFELGRITVLVGDNASGKSAALRALKWLMFNQWDGKAGDQITWGEEVCEVRLELGKHTIVRRRSKDDNLYILDGEEYRAFKDKVPAEIVNLLKMSAHNLQEQEDPPFWLMLTSGQAASALNDIFDLTAIDNALSSASAEVRKAKTLFSDAEVRLEKAKEDEKELAWVPAADELLQEWESLEVELEAVVTKKRRIEAKVRELDQVEVEQERLERALVIARKLLALCEKKAKLEETIRSARELMELEEQRCRLEKELTEKQKQLAEWMAGTCPLCGKAP